MTRQRNRIQEKKLTAKEKDEALLNRMRSTNKEVLIFDSTDMTPFQVMAYLLEESQKIAYDRLGRGGSGFILAKAIKARVKYKMPLNIINEILEYFWWKDSAGIYNSFRVAEAKPSVFTVQELVEELMHLDPFAPVVLGDLNVGTLLYANPTEEYMLKDGSSNRLIVGEDFHPSLADKMKKVIVLEAEIPQPDNSRTTSYTMCYSKQVTGEEKIDMIKWMFQATHDVIDGNEEINIMSELDEVLKDGGNFDIALKILDPHVEWVEV